MLSILVYTYIKIMEKNTKTFYDFLYQRKKEWINFCFSWLKTIWVKKWKHIPSYNKKYDILIQTGIDEEKLKLIINIESNINKNIEIRSHWLMIWLTDKWSENFRYTKMPWYEKIHIDWKWFIWIIFTMISIFIAILKLLNDIKF